MSVPKIQPKFQLKMKHQIPSGRLLPNGKLSGYQLFRQDLLIKTPNLSHYQILSQWNLLSTSEREIWKRQSN
jgi:hypothetical protein